MERLCTKCGKRFDGPDRCPCDEATKRQRENCQNCICDSCIEDIEDRETGYFPVREYDRDFDKRFDDETIVRPNGEPL